VPKPDHIFDLERRQQFLEDEIAKALSHCSPGDPMVADLKRRMLHLKDELERFCNKAIADKRLLCVPTTLSGPARCILCLGDHAGSFVIADE